MNKTSKCPVCNGEKKLGRTTYTADLGFGVLVVRDVPARICVQCGEEWIDASTAKTLEKLIGEARNRKMQFEVLIYKNDFSPSKTKKTVQI
jgi:YgiT-type zinc finger domain-containing protein